MKKIILVVEDDRAVAEGLREVLDSNGYQVLVASTKQEAKSLIEKEAIHLILLDVHLGEESGFALCEELREKKEIPVLFLTACSSEEELVRGFQAGGDDYVTKPFRVKELLMRIQAILKRTAVREEAFLKSGDLLCDKNLCQMKKKNQLLELTVTEWKIALTMMMHWPNTMSREELFYRMWDKDAMYVAENTLSVNISRLRDKLGTYEEKNYIETVRGIGYRWTIPVER